MTDHYRKVTRQNWGGKIGGSFKNSFFGLIVFASSIALLWWNEGRAVKTTRGLQEGESVFVEAIDNAPNTQTENKLVHLTGLLATDDHLEDTEFGVYENCIRLDRVVEMYQWKETSTTTTNKQIGGSTETITDYYYEKVWSKDLINSSSFEQSHLYSNPTQMPYSNTQLSAADVTLGSYQLSDELIGVIRDYESVSLQESKMLVEGNLRVINEEFESVTRQKVYVGYDSPGNPSVGDVKVHFIAVQPGEYSAIGLQDNDRLVMYDTEEDTKIGMVSKGSISADKMFEKAHSANNTVTWVLRTTGVMMMYTSIMMMASFIFALTDLLPFLTTILRFATSLIAGIFTFIISLTTIAIAWIYYRPILGFILLMLALGGLLYFYKKWLDKKRV